MRNNPIVLHVTNEVFDLFKKGVKTSEYRPQTRYYMQRLEKARDYLAYCKDSVFGYLEPGLFLDLRKAYLPKESHNSWFYAKVRGISLVRFEDIPENDRKQIRQIPEESRVTDFRPEALKKIIFKIPSKPLILKSHISVASTAFTSIISQITISHLTCRQTFKLVKSIFYLPIIGINATEINPITELAPLSNSFLYRFSLLLIDF